MRDSQHQYRKSQGEYLHRVGALQIKNDEFAGQCELCNEYYRVDLNNMITSMQDLDNRVLELYRDQKRHNHAKCSLEYCVVEWIQCRDHQ